MHNEKAFDNLTLLRELMTEIAKLFPDNGFASEEMLSFRETLSNESDRGCALMAAAFLEEHLAKLIKAFLVEDESVTKKLFEFNGALGTFSSKIDIAYSLGLLPKNAKRDLNLLRKIRNDFAHVSTPISFTTEPISLRCRELALDGKSPRAHPRGKFTRSMMCILAIIHGIQLSIERRTVASDHDITPQQEGIKFMKKFLVDQGSPELAELIES